MHAGQALSLLSHNLNYAVRADNQQFRDWEGKSDLANETFITQRNILARCVGKRLLSQHLRGATGALESKVICGYLVSLRATKGT